MILNFSNEYYKEKAMRVTRSEVSRNHSVVDAFMMLINGVIFEDLSNLCYMIKNYFSKLPKPVELTLEECYELTQGRNVNSIVIDNEVKAIILNLAYKCIETKKYTGTRINDGKMNKSSSIGHSLLEGKLAGEFAEKLGLDAEKAKIMGILHDYGRKETHTLSHVIRGYELLVDEGWEEEAIACLTHSFLAGGRCACNSKAEESFYIDDDGTPRWEEGTDKDDITKFLENYKYSKYDIILNIADLMATSTEIVSPYDRLADIATRRNSDDTNRGYFLATFTNKLIELLRELNLVIPNELSEEIKAAKGVSLDFINQRFKKVSDFFFEAYKKMISIK